MCTVCRLFVLLALQSVGHLGQVVAPEAAQAH
jgi:hypothetical protein